jgi:hypothetical protein
MVPAWKRVRRKGGAGLDMLLGLRGKVLMSREQLYDWQLHPLTGATHNPVRLSEDAKEYLVPNNPKLLDLKRRYANCDPDVTTPLTWTEGYIRTADLAYFRGDNAYVWQVRDSKFNLNILAYALSTYYVKSIDCYNLLDKLQGDDAFGNFIFNFADRVVSRDLLDSVLEIAFLDRHLSLMTRSDVSILDIGAGYGRLAYRASMAIPGLRLYLCVDAVPYSTFISDFYLRYRRATEKTKVIPLDEIELSLATNKIDIAVNICSFPECRLEAIEWWISRLERYKIKHLMVNCEGESLINNNQEDFSSILEKHGYRLLTREPKYRDPVVQRYAVAPNHYFLFQLL